MTQGTQSQAGASKIMEVGAGIGQTVEGALEEGRWIEATRKGDGSAFGRLAERYQDRVFNVCLRIVGGRAAAEDLTQEAFLKAFASITRFDGRAAFYTWLYRIAVNLCMSAKRKGSRTSYSLDADRSPADRRAGRAGDGLTDPSCSPHDAAERREQHELVLAALAELDDDHRAVVILRDIESLDYAEIAEILKVPAGTVKSRLHRARLALRERLASILGNE